MTLYRFTEEAEEVLEKLSERLDVPVQEVIKEALSILRWIVDEHDKGTKFVLHRPEVLFKLPVVGEVFASSPKEIVFNLLEKTETKEDAEATS